jgi:large subunit ribosomal protein L10
MPMRKREKEAVVEELRGTLQEYDVILLSDFTGMNVETATEIRKRFHEASVTYRVVKNTLARRAFESAGLADLAGHLKGPNGLVLAKGDPIAAAQILVDFEKRNDTPKITTGWIEENVVTAAEIRRIASLPSRDQLLAQIAAGFQAPVSGLARLLHELTRKMVATLDAVAKQKGAESGA